MERETLIESALTHARELGWTEFTVEDNGATVIVLCSAPGSTEQLIDEPLRALRSAFSDLGHAENYPVVEEYDVGPCADLAQREAEEAAQPPRDWRDDQDVLEHIEREREAEEAYADMPQHVAVPGVEDVKPHGFDPWLYHTAGDDPVNLKQIYRTMFGHTDAHESGDGIPRVQQIVNALEEDPEGLVFIGYRLKGVDVNTGPWAMNFGAQELEEAMRLGREARKRAHSENFAAAVKIVPLYRRAAS